MKKHTARNTFTPSPVSRSFLLLARDLPHLSSPNNPRQCTEREGVCVCLECVHRKQKELTAVTMTEWAIDLLPILFAAATKQKAEILLLPNLPSTNICRSIPLLLPSAPEFPRVERCNCFEPHSQLLISLPDGKKKEKQKGRRKVLLVKDRETSS